MQPVAGDRLRDLEHEGGVVGHEQFGRGIRLVELFFQLRSLDAERGTGNLRQHTVGRRFRFASRGHADGSFVADGGHFDHAAVRHDNQGRKHRFQREKRVLDLRACFVQHLAAAQIDGCHPVKNPLARGLAQPVKKLVNPCLWLDFQR